MGLAVALGGGWWSDRGGYGISTGKDLEIMERQEEFRSISLGALRESASNTRRTFKDGGLQELAESIRHKGVISPLIARPIGEDGQAFEIAAGHRRYRAAQLAGVDQVPVIIRNYTDDEFLEVITVENLQREDVHPMEEAQGYSELLRRPGYDVGAIAAKIGKDAGYVTRRLRLNDLIQPLRDAFRAEKLTLGHAQVLARLGAEQQKQLAERDLWDEDGGAFSIQALQRVIEEEILMDLSKAAFPISDHKLVPEAGACVDCVKRTGFAPSLFPEIKQKDCCTDRECFGLKARSFAYAKVKFVEKEEGRAPIKLSAHWATETEAGVVNINGWKAAKRANCTHSQRGVIVRTGFNDDFRMGDVLDVCLNKKCTVHWGPATNGYGGTPAEKPKKTVDDLLTAIDLEEKEAAQGAVRKALVAAAVEATVYPFSAKVFREVVRVMWTDLWTGHQATIRARRGLDPRNDRVFPPPPDSMLEELGELNSPELAALLVEIAIMSSGAGNPVTDDSDLVELLLSSTSDETLQEIEAAAVAPVKQRYEEKREKVRAAHSSPNAPEKKEKPAKDNQPAATPAAKKKGKAKV